MSSFANLALNRHYQIPAEDLLYIQVEFYLFYVIFEDVQQEIKEFRTILLHMRLWELFRQLIPEIRGVRIVALWAVQIPK